MQNPFIIQNTEDFVKKTLANDSGGHDWWHIFRVRKMAKYICGEEGGNLFLIELAALLHDVADWKFHHGNEEKGVQKVRSFLEKQELDSVVIEKIAQIIREVSFKGAGHAVSTSSLEAKIVQDADRLDALGAIGIARCFAYGGSQSREIYNPDIKPHLHKDFKEYKKSKGTTINHFYEKLLLLKDRMNTQTAKKIAEQRHQLMENYLKDFYKEWNLYEN
jgi:uncharacterized protein